MEILEKVAYLKGLAEGLGLDSKSKEGKLLSVIIDVLDDIALEIRDMQEDQADLEEGLDAVSDDLSEVESYLYEEDDEEEDEDEDEEPIYETTCPNCGEDLVIDCVAVEPSAPPQYYDLLFRTLLFKAVSLPAARICAAEERTDGFYAAFGFQKKGSEWAVLPKDVVFPSSCKDCPAPCKERQSGPAPEGEKR